MVSRPKAAPAAASSDPDWGVEFESLDEQPEYTNLLYYGNEGTGKTTHAATMANLGRVVLVSAESGAKKRPLRRMGVDVGNIVTYPRQGERVTYEGLERLYWKLKSDLAGDPNAWAGVVWDSITEIHKALVDNIADAAADKASRAGMEFDRFFIDRTWYGRMTEQLRLLLRRYRDLPCHMAITALERRDQDDDGEVTYGPAVTPALQNDLLGYVDLVCHTTVRQVAGADEYLGEFRPRGKYRAKERLAGAVPSRLVDPTFERVHAYAIEQMTVDDDPVMIAARQRRAEAKMEAADAG